jgi:phosphatidylserine/phosphatidylglycerophosphate/cardiolipin synthase-like enzyme
MFSQRKFGPSKPKGSPNPRLSIGGTRVETYFSPQDDVAERLIALVDGEAQRHLYFMAFSYTHDGLGQSMVRRAQAGATVQGVFETTGSNTTYSEYGRLKQAGLDVYQDGNPWVMHHKVLVLDERTVVLGSFNFSEGADRSNDENVMVVEDPRLAQAYKTEYDRVLALAKNPPVRKK